MPELPEVETVKTELAPHVVGQVIKAVTLNWEGIVKEPSVKEFLSRIKGRKIESLSRRAKFLLFKLDGSQYMVIHLRMTGSLWLSDPERFVRAIIHLGNGTDVFFRDPRKFGLIKLVKDRETITGRLGPEPLEPGFTPELMGKILEKKLAPIKALLCEQDLIAGIGNMYADEALWEAKIHPLHTGSSLTKEEIARLHKAILKVLKAGIKNKGASVDTYFRPDGSEGTAHEEFKVAHNGGKKCPRCGTPIQRIVVRGRGTYFCPNCQKL